MGGEIEFGTPEFNVTNATPPKPLVVLEDAQLAVEIVQGFRDFSVSLLDDRVYTVQTVQTDFEIVLENAEIIVEAYIPVVNLSEYEERLIELTSYYGFSTVAKDVFDKLDRLVRIELYEGVQGITNE